MSWRCCHFLIVLFVTVVSPMARVASSSALRQKRSDDGGPLETVVEQLSAQVNHLNAQLSAQITSLNAQLTSVNGEVAVLKTKTASLEKVVAFYAWSTTYPIHAAAQSPIILNHAATNIGNGYDTLSGIFTAPVSGTYDFQGSFMNHHSTSDHHIRIAIYVDSAREAITISDSQQGSYDHATMRAIVHVNAGQKVYVKNIDDRDEQYEDALFLPYTTFSGFLIKAD